jgi:hypothetical protein
MSSSVVLLFGSQAESNAANAIAAAMSRRSIAGLSQPNAQAANHKRDSGEGGAQHSVAHGAFKLRFRTTPRCSGRCKECKRPGQQRQCCAAIESMDRWHELQAASGGNEGAIAVRGAVMERTARCHCGNLRLIAVGAPEWTNLCHCLSCQRRTGTAVHSGAYFLHDRVSVEGVSRIFGRTADSGFEMHFHFCPDCGSNVYWQASRFPRHYGVAVGCFADPDFPTPSFSVWQQTMHRWLTVPAWIDQFNQGRRGPPLGVESTQANSA